MQFRGAFLSTLAFLTLYTPLSTYAAPATITFRYKHFLFPITVKDVRFWQLPEETWTCNGIPITPPAELRVDGDTLPELPTGMIRSTKMTWNRAAIAQAIRQKIVTTINRAPGNVSINRNASGAVIFEGVGLPGRKVREDATLDLAIQALEEKIAEAWLPVEETEPTVMVLDTTLKSKGITELVTVGESDFSNSPKNRRHNIAVGLARFNGHYIEQGENFSFLKVLGPVDGTTGYKKELVIKGDKTVPDFGGGLCQVSTTAYRGIWEYGFPITKRQNHSFAVNHYMPVGTDATVFTSGPDLQFLNDSPGALIIQTYAEGDLAYFLYYGTRDSRSTELIGPFTWDHEPAPPQKTEYTTEIAPGTKRKVGDAVAGLKAMWFRTVKKDGKENTDNVFSAYSARPLFYQIGISGEVGSGETISPAAIDPSA